jgi:hypothetical protein
MKTINDLKENRSLIIKTITNEYGAEFVKPVMEMMVKSIGFNGYFEMNAKQFTHAVIKDNNLVDSVIIRRGIAASAILSEINHQAARKMMSIR